MSDTAIFLLGAFTTLLLSGGLGFTFMEVRRIEERTRANQSSKVLSGDDLTDGNELMGARDPILAEGE